MRVLVTGAGGFVGSHTVRGLVADGHDVVAFGPNVASGPQPATRIEGSVTDPAATTTAVQGCHAVVHLAALLPQRHRPPDEMRAVNTEGTRVVVAAAEAAGTRRFVFCSSAEVYGVPAVVPMPEDGPLAPNGAYGRTKVAAEAIVQSSRLEWVILRPPTIVGPGMPEPLLTKMLDDATRNRTLLIPGGRTRFQMVHVDDVVDAIRLALTRSEAARGIFNLGADAVPTGRELAEGLTAALGSTSRVVCVPEWVSRPVLRLLAALGRPVLEPEHIDITFADYLFDTSRAKRVLGWQPHHSLVDAFMTAVDTARARK